MDTALAVIAIVISAAALMVSIWTAVSNRRSAAAAEDSAVSSRQSADSSRDSARSAEAMVRVELDRDHRANTPPRTGRFVGRDGNLYYEVTLDRRYEARARVTGYGTFTNDLIPAIRTADGVLVLHIGRLDDDKLDEPYDTLTVKFWSPAPRTDEPEPWTCPCGLPQEVGDGSAAHWQWSHIGIPRDRRAVHEDFE